MIATTLKGDKELDAALAELPKRIQGKVMRGPLRAATKLILDAVKVRAPVDTGTLKRSLTVRALKRSRTRIGFNIVFKNVEELARTTKAGKRYFVPAILEYGTATRAARPFMRPAFDATAGAAERLALEGIREGIEREAAALKKI